MSKNKNLTVSSTFIIGATCITGASLFYAFTKYNKREKFKKSTVKAIPTVPIPTVPIPTVPIPTVPIPTVPIPTVPIPTVPIPTVPIPTVPIPLLTMKEIENLENLYRLKLVKYTENCQISKNLEPDDGLVTERKISNDMWFKSPVSSNEECINSADIENEWCDLSKDI
jgi:hypothetical protein